MGFEFPILTLRKVLFAALITGWVHGITDFLLAQNALSPVLYDWSDKTFLWVITTGIITAATLLAALLAWLIQKGSKRLLEKRPFIRVLFSGMLWGIPLIIMNIGISKALGGGLFALLLLGFVATGGLLIFTTSLYRPMAKTLAFIGLMVAAGLSFLANATVLTGLYPYQHESLTYVSLSFTFAAFLLVFRPTRTFKLLTWGLLGVTVIMLIESFGLSGSMKEGVRAAIFGKSVETVHALQVLEPMLDPDMDGATAFAGIDCANFDPSTHPGAKDIIDDAKDQDCLGGPALSVNIEQLLKKMAMDKGLHQVLPANTPVIFLSVDALRQDFAKKMKTYRFLKTRSTEFINAHCAYPGTILSFYSLLTGKAPLSIRTKKWIKWQVPVNDTSQTLAQVLAGNGYTTAGLFFHGMLDPSHGITKGFQFAWTEGLAPKTVVWGEAARVTADKAIAALGSLLKAGRPFFLWVHFYDPHEPYIQHKGFPVKDPKDWRELYDGEVRYTDFHMMRLIRYLKKTGLLDRALVFFFADHGESLGEHDRWFHDSDMYEEQTKVPLLVSGPGLPKGNAVLLPVSLRWLGDTVCDLLGLQRPRNTQGGSLYPFLTGSAPKSAVPVFMEVSHLKNLQRAVILWPWKLIYHVNNAYFELYDLKRDPYERINLYDFARKTASSLEKVLGTWVAFVVNNERH